MNDTYDVVIIGGSLAGASTATLLLREKPELRVLILERAAKFSRRVGEATVETSAFFLSRVLGLTQYLNESQLVKQGMRFWFAGAKTASLADCSEIGGKYLVRVPAYQVDRSTLDEEVLRRAVALGAEIWRPATVKRVDLGQRTVHLSDDRQVKARWIVDASGVSAVLARQEGWLQPNTEHPTTAIWARWRGVKDWDGYELAQKYPMWAKQCYGVRGTATNHLTGYGWWAWVIPLKGGDMSVGVVYDQRYVDWPRDGTVGEQLRKFLMRNPVGRELLADAEWIEGDVHSRKNLAYYSTKLAGDGFVLVGDAGAFLDPLYSPGMDWVAYTSYCANQIILGNMTAQEFDADFALSYRRWFEALYKDKYEYLSEFDLMRVAFLLDVGLYYVGVVRYQYRDGEKALLIPVFAKPVAVPAFLFMRLYNRRLAAIGRSRRARGMLHRRNENCRLLITGFTLSSRNLWQLGKGMAAWMLLELTEGWRTWFEPRPQRGSVELAPLGPGQAGGEKIPLGQLPGGKLSA